MSLTKQEYNTMVNEATPPSKTGLHIFNAFWIGGLICAAGEALFALYEGLRFNEEEVKAAVPITLICITAVLTAIGVFDKIAKHAGAGTIVPITGFANSVVAPALEFKHEGHVLGTSAKMFTLAGPVIVFGTAFAFIYGVVLWILTLTGRV